MTTSGNTIRPHLWSSDTTTQPWSYKWPSWDIKKTHQLNRATRNPREMDWERKGILLYYRNPERRSLLQVKLICEQHITVHRAESKEVSSIL